MSDPRTISSSTPASRHGIILDNTPEWSIQESLDEVSRELENYRSHMRDGDPAAANRAIERAERRLPAAPAAAAAAPLRAAIAELRNYLRPDADAAAAEVSNARRNTGGGRPSLQNAVRAFARSGSTRALMSHFGSTPRAALRRLASVNESELKAQLVEAGATREQATEMLGRLRSTAAPRFHRMAVGQARMQVRDAAREFRSIARGRGLEEMATRLANGEGTQLLDQMRASGIDMTGIDAARASGDVDVLAAELRPALQGLAHRLDDLRTEIGQNSDLSGALYITLPGAARVAAENVGVNPGVVDGVSDGTVLGSAIAEHAQEANEAQDGARTWLTRTLAIMPFLGGMTAPIAVAVEVADAHTTNSTAERTNLAATTGLASSEEAEATAEHAEDSTRDALIGSATAVVGETVAHGVGHGVTHTAESYVRDSVATLLGRLAQGTTESVFHEGAHAVEHQVLHGEH